MNVVVCSLQCKARARPRTRPRANAPASARKLHLTSTVKVDLGFFAPVMMLARIHSMRGSTSSLNNSKRVCSQAPFNHFHRAAKASAASLNSSAVQGDLGVVEIKQCKRSCSTTKASCIHDTQPLHACAPVLQQQRCHRLMS